MQDPIAAGRPSPQRQNMNISHFADIIPFFSFFCRYIFSEGLSHLQWQREFSLPSLFPSSQPVAVTISQSSEVNSPGERSWGPGRGHRLEHPETDPHKCSQPIYDKDEPFSGTGQGCIFNNGIGSTGEPSRKRKDLDPYLVPETKINSR